MNESIPYEFMNEANQDDMKLADDDALAALPSVSWNIPNRPIRTYSNESRWCLSTTGGDIWLYMLGNALCTRASSSSQALHNKDQTTLAGDRVERAGDSVAFRTS